MIKVLFVCLGNICRSPMAEGVFRKHVSDKALDKLIECDSAGTSTYHIGSLPDVRMRGVAQSYAIELVHKARQVNVKDFTEFTYVIAMDNSNLESLQLLSKQCQSFNCKLHLMREFDDIRNSDNVPDPYYGGDEGFLEVYDILNRSCEKLLEHIVRERQLFND